MTDTNVIDAPDHGASVSAIENEPDGELEKTSKQPPAAPAPANDPEEELEKKKQELAACESEATQLKAEIKALTDKIAEFNQATSGYEAFEKSTSDQLSEQKTRICEKTKMAKSVIDDTVVQDIDKKITDGIAAFYGKLDQLKKNVANARTALDTARTTASQSDAEYQAAQACYETHRKFQKTIETSLKESLTLLTLAENAHDHNDHVQMYLLTQIAAQALTNNIKIPPLSDYKQTLKCTKAVADHKKMEADKQKRDVDQKSKALTDLVKQYDGATASELTDLLKQLKDIKPGAN